MKRISVPILLACCVFCTGMSRKPKFTISVHSQAAAEDNPRMIFKETLGGQEFLFKLVPEFSQTNIAAVHPFPAQDGNGSGLALKLDFHGASALEMATRMRTGQLLLAKVNGKSCDAVTIDRPVGDGIFTIWSGVPENVIKELEKKYPHISQSRSAGTGIEMTPTTKKEKREARRKMEEEKKQKAKEEAAAGKSKGGFFGLFGRKKKEEAPEVAPFPQGPATSQIPLEGAAPVQPPGASPPASAPMQPAPLLQPLPQR